MTLKTLVAHGLKWQVISIVGKQVLSLAVFSTLARLLEPSAFGLVALVGAYLGFVAMFADQGIRMALIQRQNLEPEHLDTAFWFNMGCAVVLCLGTIALASQVAMLFNEPRLAPLLRWTSIVLVIAASSAIHATLYVKAMDFRRLVICTLIANVAGGVIGVGMALGGCGVWALAGQQLASEFASALFLWRVSTYRPSVRFSVPHLRELLGFSSSVFAASILWYFSSRIDELVIGRFAGVPLLGLYSIAGKAPNMANLVTRQPMVDISLPALSRLQGDHGQMRNAIYRGMELNAIVSFAVFVGLAAVASDLVPLLFGLKWAAAALLCSLLSLNSLINALHVFCNPTLLASGGTGKYVFLNIWHVTGVVVASLVGIQFGLPYLVLGLIANSLIITIPALLFLRRRIGLSPLMYCKPCLVPALASLFMIATIWITTVVLPGNLLLGVRLSFKVLFGGAAYLAFVFIFAPATFEKVSSTIGHAFRRTRVIADVPVGTSAK